MYFPFISAFILIIQRSLAAGECTGKECYFSAFEYKRGVSDVEFKAFSFNLTQDSLAGLKVDDLDAKNDATLKVKECSLAEYSMSSHDKDTYDKVNRMEVALDNALSALPDLYDQCRKGVDADSKIVLDAFDKLVKFGKVCPTSKVRSCTAIKFTIQKETISLITAPTFTIKEILYKNGKSDVSAVAFQVTQSSGDLKIEELEPVVVSQKFLPSSSFPPTKNQIAEVAGGYIKNEIGKKIMEKLKSGSSGVIIIVVVVGIALIICVAVVVMLKKKSNK